MYHVIKFHFFVTNITNNLRKLNKINYFIKNFGLKKF